MAASPTTASLELSADEVLLLNNALNEVLHGIDIPEFPTRLGVAPSEAERLLKELGTLLDKMDYRRWN